jgi:hypothetical protein
MYIPANTSGLMVQAVGGTSSVDLQVLNHDGNSMCGSSSYGECVIDYPIIEEGVYYVRIRSMYNEDYSNITLSAAWAGVEGGTLQNGIPITDLSGESNTAVLQSMYIPANTSGLMVQAVGGTSSVDLQVLNHDGNSMCGSSSYGECVINYPVEEGVYYVRIRSMYNEDYSNVALSAAWAGVDGGTLQNGIPITGLSGELNSLLLQSFYIPINTDNFSVVSPDTDIRFEVLNEDGQLICGFSNECLVNQPAEGVFYVRLWGMNEFTNVSLMANW